LKGVAARLVADVEKQGRFLTIAVLAGIRAMIG
jgi:hypothetical protein